jgi:hypothetical protein
VRRARSQARAGCRALARSWASVPAARKPSGECRELQVEVQAGRGEPPGYPTHLDAGVVTDPKTPEELLSTINHLALNDAIDENRFQELYLHHFGPLGATAGAAHDH